MKSTQIFKISLLTAVLVALQGCGELKDKFKGCCKKNETKKEESKKGETLLSLNGKDVISSEDFEGYVKTISDANPQMAAFLQAMPEMKERVFEGMVAEKIMQAWAEKEKIRETEDFKKIYNLTLADVDRQLVSRTFQQHLLSDIKVSEEDITSYYDKNKDSNPKFIESRGGYKASGIEFGSKQTCSTFISKTVKADQFKKLAQAEKLKIEDFGVVNDTNFKIDKELKKIIASAKTAPTIISGKSEDGKQWALLIEKKEETKYRKIADVQEEVKTSIMNERLQESFGKEIARLKVAYNAQEARSFFKKNVQVAQIDDVSDVSDEIDTTESKALATKTV